MYKEITALRDRLEQRDATLDAARTLYDAVDKLRCPRCGLKPFDGESGGLTSLAEELEALGMKLESSSETFAAVNNSAVPVSSVSPFMKGRNDNA